MHRLRHAAFLARCVLAWFVLSLGVAVAAPVVQLRGVELICAAGSFKLLLPADGNVPHAMALDCPLCSPSAAPPPAVSALPLLVLAATTPVARATLPQPALAQLPPSARGPPAAQA
jgi:hypothetical protein